MGDDEALLDIVSTAHIACGFHAGDPEVMWRTLVRAARTGVVVGAHPSYPDLTGFGRRPMDVPLDRVRVDLLYQLGALDGLARVAGTCIRSVKPHGALYNRMAVEPECARAIVEAVASFSEEMWVVMPAGSPALRAAREIGPRVVAEAFCDRAYLSDGRLAPRELPGAVIDDPERAAQQALALATGEPIDSIDGTRLHLEASTLCVHGDSPGAAGIATAVRSALLSGGISITPYVGAL
jgi:5-oxoprolinase (ATP-hydrolysing) subunit A